MSIERIISYQLLIKFDKATDIQKNNSDLETIS